MRKVYNLAQKTRMAPYGFFMQFAMAKPPEDYAIKFVNQSILWDNCLISSTALWLFLAPMGIL